MSNKICVYAICKNELKFINKWLDNMSEADYIVVLDTGSTDGTYEALQKDSRITRVEQKIYDQFRFDVARNDSMKLIPEDTNILVCTDFDELFEPGWADILRENWIPGQHNRAHYQYIWKHNSIGLPQDSFVYDKIHTKDFYWKYPVHEVLWHDNVELSWLELVDKITLHHWQDNSKNRSSYEPLLKLSCEENPNDCHTQYLYAREKLLNQQYHEAIDEYLFTLQMPEIREPTKGLVLLSAHLQIATCFLEIEDYWETISYCQDFIYINPTYRDPYFLMAEAYMSMNMWTLAEATVLAGLKYSVKHNDWVETANAWLWWADYLLGIIYWNLNEHDKSLQHLQTALKYEPDNVEILQRYNSFLQIAYNTLSQH